MSTHAADARVEHPTDADGVDEVADTRSENSGVGGVETPSVASRWRGTAKRWRVIVAACLLLTALSITGVLYIQLYRPDRAEADNSRAVIDAASRGSVALLSYAPATLEQDLATARAQLTGDFLDYYSQFVDQFVAPAAKQRDIKATASVVRAAAVDVVSNTAEVLIFVNQETSSRDTAVPAQASSSVRVGMTKVDGKWLISSFDPV